MRTLQTTIMLSALLLAGTTSAAPLEDLVEHHYAENNGVKIHYVTLGQGPLVVMIHGFPDYWYSWRLQIPLLAKDFRVAAMDQRGYNRSDKPKGQENYDTALLVQDVAAVIEHVGAEKAIVVGHDWGGHVAWSVAMARPDLVAGLVILNLPHPRGFMRELANNPAQQESSAYARAFQQPGAHAMLSPETLADMVAKDSPEVRKNYVDAFGRSDLEAMLHYYKQNYPKPPYTELDVKLPRISVPVLQFHGLADTALLHQGLNNTWEEIDAPYTLVTIPGAGHWVHHDAPDQVNTALADWLKRNRP